MNAKINSKLCTGCGACIEVCPFEAIQIENGKAKVNDETCVGCGVCAAGCLVGAIQIM